MSILLGGIGERIDKADHGGRWPICADAGYPIIYYVADGETLCAACANGENGSEATEDHAEAQWRLYGADVYWEGPDESCAHCGATIASAYGDPDTSTIESER